MDDDHIKAAQQAVHEALVAFAEEGEIIVRWITTIEIASHDGGRYLAHRSGGGFDGTDSPATWEAAGLGMSQIQWVKRQLDMSTCEPDDEDDDED